VVFSKKFIFVVTLLAFSAYPLAAQEFWMMPDKFSYVQHDSIRIKFSVGENFVGDTWNLRAERIKSVSVYHNGKVTNLTSKLKEGRGEHVMIPDVTEGTYVVSMESNNVFVELAADQFNAYLKEYALDDASARRKKNNTSGTPGREVYSRNAKVIVQVGPKEDNGYKTITGLPLEIVPEKNPGQIKKGEMVKFRILYNGKPEFGARAFVWNNKDNRTYVQPIYSQQDGAIDVRIFNDGQWMVSVVKMIPSNDKKADWQSYWGSLVFDVN
jgi:uncharacterized GH25 family protein